MQLPTAVAPEAPFPALTIGAAVRRRVGEEDRAVGRNDEIVRRLESFRRKRSDLPAGRDPLESRRTRWRKTYVKN